MNMIVIRQSWYNVGVADDWISVNLYKIQLRKCLFICLKVDFYTDNFS